MFTFFPAVYIFIFTVANRLRGTKFAVGKNQDKKSYKILDIFTGKTQISLILGLLSAFFANNILAGIAVAIGYRIWAAPGWGMYFVSTTGDLSSLLKKEKGEVVRKDGKAQLDSEVYIIDYITDRFTKILYKSNIRRNVLKIFNSGGTFEHSTISRVRIWGLIAMALRGQFFSFIFTPLALLYNNPLIALMALPCGILQGLIYYFMHNHYSTFLDYHSDWINGFRDKPPKDNAIAIAEIMVGFVLGVALFLTFNYLALDASIGINDIMGLLAGII